MLARLSSKSFKLGFSSTWTETFQMYKLDLEKAEEPESNCQYTLDHRKSKGITKKISTSAPLTTLKPMTGWITSNCGIFLKRLECQTTFHAPWETLYAGQEATIGTGHGKMDLFKIGNGVHQVCKLSPAYLTYVQSTSNEILGWISHKLESRWPGEYQQRLDILLAMHLRYADDNTLMAESEEELKSLLIKVKEESEKKTSLKLNIQKIKIMTSSPITSWQIDGEKVETVSDFLAFQNQCGC